MSQEGLCVELKRGVACGYSCMQMATGVMVSVFFTFLVAVTKYLTKEP